jgi:uncharacterized membrane protein
MTERAAWLTRLSRAVGLAMLEAASAGFAVWALLSHSLMPAYARDNRLGSEGRRFVFLDMGIGLAVALAIVVGVFLWKRRDGLGFLERLVRRMAPLALAGAVPFLFDWRLWPDREIVFLSWVVAFGFGARLTVLTAWETEPLFERSTRLRDAVLDRWRELRRATLDRFDAPLVAVVIGACAYAAYFSVVTITYHRNLGTSSFDLGLEDNLMWNLVHGGPLFRSAPFSGPTGSHFGHHATFFAYVMAPVYWLAPRPETLLVIQAVLMGAAAVPLFLYARCHLPPGVAAIVAYLYLAYPPLHGANLYDFHYLPLGVFFLWLVLYAVQTRRRALAIVAALLAMSVREDVAGNLAVMGAFLLLTGAAAIEGALLSVVGGAYFLLMKLLVMPRFKNGVESFVNQYAGLLPPGKSGFGGVLETIVGNPAFAANVVFERDKLAYVLQLVAPLLLLPLRSPIGILLVLPGVIFTLLSTGASPLYQISFQYTSYWTAFLFVGLVLALARAGNRTPAQRAMVVGLLAASLACTFYNGAFLQHPTVRGGFAAYRFGTTDRDLRRRQELAELLAHIPADARVSASELLVPHVSGRRDAYTLRFGVYDADYLLFEEPLGGDERANAWPRLQDGTFGVVQDLGDMALVKRGHPTTLNPPP